MIKLREVNENRKPVYTYEDHSILDYWNKQYKYPHFDERPIGIDNNTGLMKKYVFDTIDEPSETDPWDPNFAMTCWLPNGQLYFSKSHFNLAAMQRNNNHYILAVGDLKV